MFYLSGKRGIRTPGGVSTTRPFQGRTLNQLRHLSKECLNYNARNKNNQGLALDSAEAIRSPILTGVSIPAAEFLEMSPRTIAVPF